MFLFHIFQPSQRRHVRQAHDRGPGHHPSRPQHDRLQGQDRQGRQDRGPRQGHPDRGPRQGRQARGPRQGRQDRGPRQGHQEGPRQGQQDRRDAREPDRDQHVRLHRAGRGQLQARQRHDEQHRRRGEQRDHHQGHHRLRFISARPARRWMSRGKFYCCYLTGNRIESHFLTIITVFRKGQNYTWLKYEPRTPAASHQIRTLYNTESFHF